MISTQALTLLLALIVPCASQYAPGFGCNDTFLMVELHKCEKTMLQALIDDPTANCREEVKKLQQCSRKLIVDQCYSSLYALYPKLRKAVEKMMDVTLKQVNKASFYCSDHKMRINWEMIPNAVKKVLPCDKRFFEKSLQCAEKFRAAFNKNKKDPDLCRLYTETKRCSHRISYIYCTSSTILSVNTLNPFCDGGRDLEELPNDMDDKKKPLKCIVHVCSNSSSPFFPTPSCAPPQEITCATPEGLPFQYDACMTTSMTLEPVSGVTVTQVNRNCSSSFLCKHDVFCNTANSTGVLKTCSANCCEGELCNKDSSYKQTKIKPTKPAASSLKCVSSSCIKTSNALSPSFQCDKEQEITCGSLPGLSVVYDRCMTSRLSMEVVGITVEQEIRNCSVSYACQSELLCNTVNTTGQLKKCDIQCCKGNLCNRKKRSTKTTPMPQTTTPKGSSPLTEIATPTKSQKASSLKCVSSSCTKTSNALFPSFQCDKEQEITCESLPGLSVAYDRCMTSRLSMEVVGITVEQEIRNCSVSYACQSELLCNTVNTTGQLKKCDIQCCKGNLCNRKKRSTKTTPMPQITTPKGSSPLTEIATPTKSQKASSLKCVSSSCTKTSNALFPSFQCDKEQEITCGSLPGLSVVYDRCMTSRFSMEVVGITVEQEIRNCSLSYSCQSELLCNTVNTTGQLKKCDIQCCEGNLCNRKKRSTKTTPMPQITTPKGKPLKCMVFACSNASSSCTTPRVRSCSGPRGLSFKHDACMTSRMIFEPTAGVIVEQELRDCSTSLQCQQPKRFCDIANATGLVKRCDFHCCTTDLCNKKKDTKPTLEPQLVTQKVSSPPTELPKEYRLKFKKGFWTKVTLSMISSHLFHGLRVKYRSVNNGLVIEARVTSYGCGRRPGSGLTTFIGGNWTHILYTQEFMGSASCWRVFGNSGRRGGYERVERSGLEEFNARKGDIIFNELKMGGKNHNAFNGITHVCGRPTKNFWHAQNGQGLRRATVMLRRKTDVSNAGIHTATSCGLPSFTVKDIYVYH